MHLSRIVMLLFPAAAANAFALWVRPDQRANQLNQRAETYHPSSSPAALTTYGSEKLPLADARALLSLIEPDSAGRVTCGGFGKPRRRL